MDRRQEHVNLDRVMSGIDDRSGIFHDGLTAAPSNNALVLTLPASCWKEEWED